MFNEGDCADADAVRLALAQTHTDLMSEQLVDLMLATSEGAARQTVTRAQFEESYGLFFGAPSSEEAGPAWGATKRAVSLAHLKEFCEKHMKNELDFKVR